MLPDAAGGISAVKPNDSAISFLLIVGGFGLPVLPACLLYSGDLALVGKIAEADTADTVLTEICMGTAADLASVILSGGVFLRPLLL